MRDQNPPVEGELTRALIACRERVDASLPRMNGDALGVDDAIRDVVCAFGALSRRRGVPPEHMLVMFKSAMRELTTAERWTTMDVDALNAALVPTLIEAYYTQGRQPAD